MVTCMDKHEIIEYCLTLPGAYEDYAFGGAWTAIKHNANRKGFAFIFERNGNLYLNLRCQSLKADFLRQLYEDVTFGYRMKKDYWNAVKVGGDVPDDELRGMVYESYMSIAPKPKKVVQKPEEPEVIKRHWPDNLYIAVFGIKDMTAPDNAEEAIKYALRSFRPREQDMVLARFKDEKVYKAIGAEHGVSSNRVSQIIKRVIRMLRHPTRTRYLTHLTQALASDQFSESVSLESRREILINRYGEKYVQDLESKSIEELGVSQLTYDLLVLNDINTLADLAILTLGEIINLCFMTQEAYWEVVAACKKRRIMTMASDELANCSQTGK